MNNKLEQMLQTLVPFLVVGVGIAIFIALLVMFFYVAVWGIVIGGVLWLAMLVKQYLFPDQPDRQKHEGRIIEHDDKK